MVRNSLLEKGFGLENNNHKMFYYYMDGKRTSIRTMISHNSDEIDDFLIGKMKNQLKLSKEQFLDLVDCPLTKEELRRYYLENGIVQT